jgi:hypothetical protein
MIHCTAESWSSFGRDSTAEWITRMAAGSPTVATDHDLGVHA